MKLKPIFQAAAEKCAAAASEIDLRDVLGIAGVALVSIGAWNIYHPAGDITLGLLLLAFAIIASRKG